MFSSKNLFWMYVSFLIIRVVAIIIANIYVIFRIKKNYKRNQVSSVCHSEMAIIPTKKANAQGD